MRKAKINYDKKKDILYIILRAGVEERFEDISKDITVEYDAKDRPIGIEIFNASKVLPSQKNLDGKRLRQSSLTSFVSR